MAGGFYGAASVIASRDKHLATGKVVTSVTLNTVTGSSVSYANAYVWPVTESSAFGGEGAATQSTTIVLWQIGETIRPHADDTITDADSNVWLIQSITTRLNADDNYAVHDCNVVRRA